MKKIVKNTTVVALSGVMAIGMLSGCGSKSIDGEKPVANVAGIAINMGAVSVSLSVRVKDNSEEPKNAFGIFK